MKKLAAILAIAALPMLSGCVVYGTGPAGNAAWANYDHTYDYGHKGYDRPITYGNSFGFDAGYGGGFSAGYGAGYGGAYGGGYGGVQADIDVGGGNGYYDSYYGSGY
jgi:hypothetical protein